MAKRKEIFLPRWACRSGATSLKASLSCPPAQLSLVAQDFKRCATSGDKLPHRQQEGIRITAFQQIEADAPGSQAFKQYPPALLSLAGTPIGLGCLQFTRERSPLGPGQEQPLPRYVGSHIRSLACKWATP